MLGFSLQFVLTFLVTVRFCVSFFPFFQVLSSLPHVFVVVVVAAAVVFVTSHLLFNVS